MRHGISTHDGVPGAPRRLAMTDARRRRVRISPRKRTTPASEVNGHRRRTAIAPPPRGGRGRARRRRRGAPDDLACDARPMCGGGYRTLIMRVACEAVGSRPIRCWMDVTYRRLARGPTTCRPLRCVCGRASRSGDRPRHLYRREVPDDLPAIVRGMDLNGDGEVTPQ